MFEAGQDQATGLRRLFAPTQLALLPLGCATGDAFDRRSVAQIARALQRAGRRPLLLDFLADGALLPRRAGAAELAALAHRLREQAHRDGVHFDVALVAADPLRLADLTAGMADRIVLLVRGEDGALAQVYSLIKALRLAHGLARYVATFREPACRQAVLGSHRRLADAAALFLGAAIEFGGVVGSGADATAAWDRLAANAIGWIQPMAVPVARELVEAEVT